jgi:hypothetical protein
MFGIFTFFLSPLGRWVGGGIAIGLAAGAIFLAGVNHEKVKFDAYKVQVQQEIAAEQARQKVESAAALASLQTQLDTAQADQTAAEKTANDLQAAIAGRPVVPGRGATQEDINALSH